MNTVTAPPDAPPVKIDPSRPTQPLFAISRTLDENRSLNPKPVYISLGLKPSAFRREFGGYEDPSHSPYAAPKSAFDAAVRGSLQHADRIWFFKGDRCFGYCEKPDGRDALTDPSPISASWSGLPPNFASGVDAVLHGTASYEGKLWFFKGNEYFRYDVASGHAEFAPRLISDNWRGIPASFIGQGLDAAVHGMGSAYYGICWFFKGPNYIRYNLKSDQAESAPRPIAGSWGKWPASFASGVDFAFYGTGNDAEKIYFFRGDQYLVYDLKSDAVEEGPAPLTSVWPQLAQFMPRPQLFLVEQYNLRIFHGEMGAGETIKTISIGPNSKTETYIITKQEEITRISSTSNVLESESDQAADAFSQALADDQTKSGSKEDYGYNVDASFHGDASMTSLGGGEANANLSVRGGTQDTRKAFAASVSKQIGHQANQTHETHRQQVRTEDTDHQINNQTESGFKQVIENGTPQPINVALYQLTQEYIAVLSLIDAQIAFRNGNPRQSMTVPVRDAAVLLQKYLTTSEAQTAVQSAVIDALDNVFDYAGQSRSLLVPVQNQSAVPARQVDAKITSTYEVRDSNGSLLRTIVVPGIVVNVDRPVVLTPNTALHTIEG
jgi:hemopexin